MVEIKLNETIKIGELTVICIPQPAVEPGMAGCHKCIWNDNQQICTAMGACDSRERSDNTSVIFVDYDEFVKCNSNKYFIVDVTERLCASYRIKASSQDDAIRKAKELYKNKQIVLTSDHYMDTNFSIYNE